MMAEQDRPIITCQALIAGFDDEGKARICVINPIGEIFDYTDSGMAAIGSGAPFSIIYFDQYEYIPHMSVEEALIFNFEAKKWAEAPRGIGRKTDMILIRKVKKEGEENYDFILKEFYDGSELLKKLEQYYNEKKRILAQSQASLINDINKLLRKGGDNYGTI